MRSVHSPLLLQYFQLSSSTGCLPGGFSFLQLFSTTPHYFSFHFILSLTTLIHQLFHLYSWSILIPNGSFSIDVSSHMWQCGLYFYIFLHHSSLILSPAVPVEPPVSSYYTASLERISVPLFCTELNKIRPWKGKWDLEVHTQYE